MTKKILNPTKDWKRTICIDFDGVIAQYTGWKGPDFYGKPLNGAKEFLTLLRSRKFKFVVFTIRPQAKIKKWFKNYKLPFPDKITNVKIPALVYIDDRGLKFNGDFRYLSYEIDNYKVYWSK